MCNKTIRWVRTLVGLTRAELAVLLCLAEIRHYATGMCFPSVRKICEYTGYGSSTVHAALNGLEEKGFIRRIPQKKASGGQSSNRYILLGAPEPKNGPEVYQESEFRSRPGPKTGVHPIQKLETNKKIKRNTNNGLQRGADGAECSDFREFRETYFGPFDARASIQLFQRLSNEFGAEFLIHRAQDHREDCLEKGVHPADCMKASEFLAGRVWEAWQCQ